jgi:hypothetical protein
MKFMDGVSGTFAHKIGKQYSETPRIQHTIKDTLEESTIRFNHILPQTQLALSQIAMSSISLDVEAGQGHSLHTPLLINEELPVAYPEVLQSSLPSSEHNNEDNDYCSYAKAEDHEEERLAYLDSMICWWIMPTLLCIQFGYTRIWAPSDCALNVRVVGMGIAMYVFSSWLFRTSLRDIHLYHSVLWCTPEVGMDITLAIILFGNETRAFLVLLSLSALLSLVVVMINAYVLYRSYCTGVYHYDELDVTYRGGHDRKWKTAQVV